MRGCPCKVFAPPTPKPPNTPCPPHTHTTMCVPHCCGWGGVGRQPPGIWGGYHLDRKQGPQNPPHAHPLLHPQAMHVPMASEVGHPGGECEDGEGPQEVGHGQVECLEVSCWCRVAWGCWACIVGIECLILARVIHEVRPGPESPRSPLQSWPTSPKFGMYLKVLPCKT